MQPLCLSSLPSIAVKISSLKGNLIKRVNCISVQYTPIRPSLLVCEKNDNKWYMYAWKPSPKSSETWASSNSHQKQKITNEDKGQYCKPWSALVSVPLLSPKYAPRTYPFSESCSSSLASLKIVTSQLPHFFFFYKFCSPPIAVLHKWYWFLPTLFLTDASLFPSFHNSFLSIIFFQGQ